MIVTNYQKELIEKVVQSCEINPNNYRDVQSLYQDKASMDMIFKEIKILTFTCWVKKYQPLTFDMIKDK